MAPEFNYQLTIVAADIHEARDLREFLLRIRGVGGIVPIDHFAVQYDSNTQTITDLTRPMGEVVRAWRIARGMKVTELAIRAGRPVTKDYVSKLEHNKITRPGDRHLNNLAEALGISIGDILVRKMPSQFP